MAFWRLEPWGEAAEWNRHAHAQKLLHDLHSSKDAPSVTLSDFIPESLQDL